MQNAPLPSPGAAEALADNPGFADLIRALAAAPDAPETRAAASVAPAVLDAIRRHRRGAFLRRLLGPASAAAAAAAVLAVLFLAQRPGPQTATSEPGRDAFPPALASSGPAPAPAGAREEIAPDLASDGLPALLAAQRPDGSWAPACGGETLAPAATGLAMLRLVSCDAPGRDAALARAASWLRSQQNADGSFGAAAAPNVAAYNLALPAAALLRLYETGAYSELFTPIDGAVSSIRARLARNGDRLTRGDVWLASALALADRLEWDDAHSGDLRRALRRIDASGDARLASVADAASLADKREALIALFRDARI